MTTKDIRMADALRRAGFQTYHDALRSFWTRPEEPPGYVTDAARRVEELGKVLLMAGWRKLRWTAGIPGNPLRHRCSWGGFDFDQELGAGHWWDHAYRLVHKASGRVIYVGEPYQVEVEAMRSLSLLAERGWEIDIQPALALHYPGRTVAVRVRHGDHQND